MESCPVDGFIEGTATLKSHGWSNPRVTFGVDTIYVAVSTTTYSHDNPLYHGGQLDREGAIERRQSAESEITDRQTMCQDCPMIGDCNPITTVVRVPSGYNTVWYAVATSGSNLNETECKITHGRINESLDKFPQTIRDR